ncbi:HNH endonuclease [Paenarthrobacter sp. UW852]|uniref:HNH endonuclease n=1 Tax=Paenarthrobacter sp. UW852 TaxID=2951989 RepID=UPI002148A3B5|nr:HNH endonuclease signature motif containing protein [Paenarthrobacter sp. UW852]MCR1160779.1 HNH endonuclease [Paenarthrobacter sp. UW852]
MSSTSPSSSIPEGFKLPKSIRDVLPEGIRATAPETLWRKSEGRCSLCGEALPADGSMVDVDHMVAKKEGTGGSNEIQNLYLAHRFCNRSRKNVPFELAKRIIPFSKWCIAHPRTSFNHVIDRYLPGGNQRVGVTFSEGLVELTFGGEKRQAPVYIDPATQTKFFFMSAPMQFIQNDDETQPRYIEHDHVRALAIDFAGKPVHEPSNCRLVSIGDDLAELKQFDGQHKTTAQILLGRTEVPMKFYVDPDLPMMQNLVVQIQQGIKKRPLSTTDTLKKLDDVVKDKVAEYRSKNNDKSPNEIELVKAQPAQNQAAFKKRLLENFEFAILDHEDLTIKEFLSTKADRNSPLTDRVLVTKIIRPLVCQELLAAPLDDSLPRENERDAIVQFINRITSNVLSDKWNPKAAGIQEDIHTRRARNFFMQGSVGWWLKAILIPAFQHQFVKAKWNRLFLEPLTEPQQERLDGYVDIICGWDIWSTTNEDQLTALRSNTLTNTQKAFPDYTNVSLQEEYGSL